MNDVCAIMCNVHKVKFVTTLEQKLEKRHIYQFVFDLPPPPHQYHTLEDYNMPLFHFIIHLPLSS